MKGFLAREKGADGITGITWGTLQKTRVCKGKMLSGSARSFLAGILVATLALVQACTGKAPVEQETGPSLALPDGCTKAHVFAPGNYIIDVEAGAVVTLHPEVQTFPLFCSPDGARAFAAMLVANGDLPKGDWQVYRLAGDFRDLAEQVGPNEYVLRTKARLSEWLPDRLERDRARSAKKMPAGKQAKMDASGKEQPEQAGDSAGKPEGQDKAAESRKTE